MPPSLLARLPPRARLPIFAGAGLALVLVLLASCGGCGRRGEGKGSAVPGAGADAGPADAAGTPATPVRDAVLWQEAKSGEVEDLATLAVHEGAVGLVEGATADAALRPIALRALAYARGYAGVPFLVRTAGAPEEGDAALALDALVEIAARRRSQEDPEDAEELREGCEGLAALARDAARPRGRRIAALRAVRMLPCSKAELPTDLDAK